MQTQPFSWAAPSWSSTNSKLQPKTWHLNPIGPRCPIFLWIKCPKNERACWLGSYLQRQYNCCAVNSDIAAASTGCEWSQAAILQSLPLLGWHLANLCYLTTIWIDKSLKKHAGIDCEPSEKISNGEAHSKMPKQTELKPPYAKQCPQQTRLTLSSEICGSLATNWISISN